jgi:tRNA pseudouridine55 synthase
MFGFINLNKPQGFTSHDCVAKIRRLIRTKKVGHGGTLDPLATGVLPIAVGQATRLLQFLPEKKAYRARIRLGMQTTTDDLEGDVIAVKEVNHLQKAEIERCLRRFNGEITQIPPMYSAIKQQGKKLYELARKGITVDVPTRKVTIDNCELISLITGEFWELEVDVTCSPGTYIRAVARDLGAMLGVGGTLANLIRTESCSLLLKDSLSLETIEEQLKQQTFQLIPVDKLLSHLVNINLDTEASKRWCQGQSIILSDVLGEKHKLAFTSPQQDDVATSPPIYSRVYQENNLFLGVGILLCSEQNILSKPKIVCATVEAN